MVANATTHALITAWVLFSAAWTCGKALADCLVLLVGCPL
jgi:hypothetical protein